MINRTHRGQILIFFLAIMSIGLLLMTALLSLQDSGLRKTQQASNKERASYLAEAGIDRGLDQLAADASYSGETLSFNDDPVVITVENREDGTKNLKAEATVTASTVHYHVTVKADNSLQFGSFSAY